MSCPSPFLPLRVTESTSSPESAAHARVMKLCSKPGAPSTISRRRLRPAGLTRTLRVLFSATGSAGSRGISAVNTVGFMRSGETVNTSSIGDPSAGGTMRRVSRSCPLPRTRSVNGVRPKPVLTAVTCRSTDA